jgi:hypothetical protein
MLRLTLASDGTPVLVNPAFIVSVRMARDVNQSFINVSHGHCVRVAHPVGDIEHMIRTGEKP